MSTRVNLDTLIPREDFEVEDVRWTQKSGSSALCVKKEVEWEKYLSIPQQRGSSTQISLSLVSLLIPVSLYETEQLEASQEGIVLGIRSTAEHGSCPDCQAGSAAITQLVDARPLLKWSRNWHSLLRVRRFGSQSSSGNWGLRSEPNREPEALVRCRWHAALIPCCGSSAEPRSLLMSLQPIWE